MGDAVAPRSPQLRLCVAVAVTSELSSGRSVAIALGVAALGLLHYEHNVRDAIDAIPLFYNATPPGQDKPPAATQAATTRPATACSTTPDDDPAAVFEWRCHWNVTAWPHWTGRYAQVFQNKAPNVSFARSAADLRAVLPPSRVHVLTPRIADPELLLRDKKGFAVLAGEKAASTLARVNVSAASEQSPAPYYQPPSLIVVLNAWSSHDGNVVAARSAGYVMFDAQARLYPRALALRYTLNATQHVRKVLAVGVEEFPHAVYHAVANTLTRLGAHVGALLRDDEDVFVHIHDKMPQAMRQLVRVLGIPDRRVLYGGVVHADAVFLPTTTASFGTAGRPHTWPLREQYWRALALPLPPRQSAIVVVVRTVKSRRFVGNGDLMVAGIVAAFPDTNVTVLRDDDFADAKAVVRAFSQAKIVIAPHGAGLVNLIFAPQHTHVLELMLPFRCACFRDLALEMGHHYTGVLYSTFSMPLKHAEPVNVETMKPGIYSIYQGKVQASMIIVDVSAVVAWVRLRL